MKKHLYAVFAFFIATLSGCAAICSPVGQTSAMHSNNPAGITVALAEFGVCAGYDLAKIAAAKLSQPTEKQKPEPPSNELPIHASGDADAM